MQKDVISKLILEFILESVEYLEDADCLLNYPMVEIDFGFAGISDRPFNCDHVLSRHRLG